MATAQSERADYERDLDLTARLICVTGGVPMGGATREKLIKRYANLGLVCYA